MPSDPARIGPWRTFSGNPVDGDGEPDAVIAHVSDLHGQLRPRYQRYYSHEENPPSISMHGQSQRIARGGGLGVLTGLLTELQSVGPVMTLMSGDTFHGSAIMTYTNGWGMIDPLNDHLQPDAYVPGNWDFSNEPAEPGNFQALMAAIDAPVLANNLYDWTDRELVYPPYQLFERGGQTIGVVGMTNPYVDRMAPAFTEGRYRFGKHPALLANAATQAREAGAALVIAVTEIGLPWMVQAAKDIESIDLMLSAHTHEYTFTPIVIESTDTVVVESGLGEAVGRIDLRVQNGQPQFRHHLYCLVEDEPTTPQPDATAQATVREIEAPFNRDTPEQTRGAGTLTQPIGTVVGRSTEPMDRQSFLESPWNTLFNDALRAHFDADLAVAHGYRYGATLPAGEITLGDLYTIFPQTTPVARGTAYGQQLTTHLERFLVDNFTPYPYEQEDGRVRSFSSNVSVKIDPTAKRGRRLVELTIDGTTVDPETEYTVATFTRPGDPAHDLGNCGVPFREITVEQDMTPVDVVVEYLQQHSPVTYDHETVVTVADDGGAVQNTPAEGPYPYVQPGIDYAGGTAYTETSLIPGTNTFSQAGQNPYR